MVMATLANRCELRVLNTDPHADAIVFAVNAQAWRGWTESERDIAGPCSDGVNRAAQSLGTRGTHVFNASDRNVAKA